MDDQGALQAETENQGIHWLQVGVWGVFLSVVMFGLGFLAGSRWGEQQAAAKPPAFVTRLIPPPAEIRPPEGGELAPADGESGGRMWGILTGREGPDPGAADRLPAPPPGSKPPEPPVKPQPGPPASLSSSSAASSASPPAGPAASPAYPAAAVSPPTPPPPSLPAPASAPAVGPRYSLQVASVPARDKAEAMVRDLTAKGYPGVRMIQAEIPGRGTWYRIRMGAFDRREDAEGWAKQVRDRERMQPQLVVEKN